MLLFIISCKKSDLLSNSFVFSLIALNTKAINSFDEKNANVRIDEQTKKRKSAYELRRRTNVMMKKRTYEMMMMIKKNEIKEKNRKKNQKMNERKKRKKRFNCVSFVIMRRFKNEMRSLIFENLRRMFFVSRFNTTMLSLIFINFFTRFEIWYCECCWKNVNSNDEKERKNHCWWLMKKIEKTEIVIEIKWTLMRENVLKILTKILTTILKTISKTRVLWIQNSLIYMSFFFFSFNLE
jgi:hypothetical protein